MSDICHLKNDANDGRYFEQVIGDVLSRKSVDPKLRQVFARGNVMAFGKKIFAHVASFSECKHIRSQWRYFAGECHGAVIEFDWVWLSCWTNRHECAKNRLPSLT